MFIYTENTLNLIETLKTSICTTNHTQNSKLRFRISHFSKIRSFISLDIQHKLAFHANLDDTINILYT